MPRYIEPENPVGIALRGVIEGELLLARDMAYEDIDRVVTAVEKRIQDGPADWLTLSDGTTFSKSWVPARPGGPAEPVERWTEFGGRIEFDEPVTRAIDSIHAVHEQRVKANTERAQERRLSELTVELHEAELEQDIRDFEAFLASIRSVRIFVQ